MDTEHRLGLLGLGVAAIALVATQLDVVPSALAAIGVSGRSDSQTVAESQQRVRELMLERSFDVRSGGMLSVNVPDADVAVRAGESNRATVKVFMFARDREWGREIFDRMDYGARLSGNELRITARNPNIDRSEWRSNRGGVGFLVEVSVPVNCDADISTSDGDIAVGDLSGTIDLETSDGDIVVGNLEGTVYLKTSDGDINARTLNGPEITIETSDGDVTAESLIGNTVTIHTSDGDISVRDLAGATRVTTGDGDISLYLDEAGDMDLRTGDGDITIYADTQLRADLDLSGGSIDLSSGFSLTGRVTPRGARGTLNGGGPTLQAHTGDGTIVFRERDGG